MGVRSPGINAAIRASLRLRPRQRHDLAPALGFGNEHGGELFRVAFNRDGAEVAEPLLDGGIGKGCVDFPVEAIDDLLRRAVGAPTP